MFNIKFLNQMLDSWFSKLTHVELAHKSVALGVMTSVFLVFIKFIAWQMTDSISLQASMMDSLLDSLVSFVVYHAMTFSSIKFDENHNYGHEKVEGLAAIFQCLIIFYSGIVILREAYTSWFNPEPIQNTMVGIIVMLISIFFVYQLIYFQKYVSRKTGSMLVKGDTLHYLADFGMNFGVIVSLIVSNYISYVDIIFGVGVGLGVLFSAFKVMRNAIFDLMDEALKPDVREQIIANIKAVPEVMDIKILRTRSAGMKKYVEAVVLLNGAMSLRQVDDIIRKVESNVSKLFEKVDILIKAEASETGK